MPAAEVDIDVALVRRLLDAQRPDLAGNEIIPLAFGWDNVSFRIGEGRVARFPRRGLAARLIDNEARWLPQLAPSLPLPVPVPEFVGEPTSGYPWRWLIVPFIPGEPAGTVDDIELAECAVQVGRFLGALHREAPPGAPSNPYRGVALADRDEAIRQRFESLGDLPARSRLVSLWNEAVAAPTFTDPAVWLHGDLHPQNLLVADGRLSGVIDFGDITAGDPATDLAVAWSLVPDEHETFWAAYLPGDSSLRTRARGWAIALGLAYVANSADNPVMEQIGECTLRAVVDLS